MLLSYVTSFEWLVLYVLAGALFGFEMLCLILGRIFEPYIVNILPHLLLCFGDNNNFVRQVRESVLSSCFDIDVCL